MSRHKFRIRQANISHLTILPCLPPPPPAVAVLTALPGIEHFCAPVMYPKTSKIITKYQCLADNPELKISRTWQNGMGKEFRNMAQGDAKTSTPRINAFLDYRMPGYIKKVLKKYLHDPPACLQFFFSI